MATASASLCTWRRTSWRTASATGMMRMANRARGGATTQQGVRSRALAPVMSVSTPVVVALAATPATASTMISMPEVTQRSRSIGLRIRRSSRSVTWIAPGCDGITARSFHLVAQPHSRSARGVRAQPVAVSRG